MLFIARLKPLLVVIFFFANNLNAQVTSIVNADFKKADSIAGLYPNHSLTDLSALSHKLTQHLVTDVEKFRAIYRWVCNNIENDYTLFTRNQRVRMKLKDPEALEKWNRNFSKTVFRTLWEKHRTVCTGYAYLVKELASQSGITSVVVDGYGRNAQSNIGGEGLANHSWNAVKLNDKWYLCDPTWSSGAIDPDKRCFIKDFENGYFLADPVLFVRSHYPLDTAWMFLKNKPDLKNFLNGPVIYRGAFRYNIYPVYPQTLNVEVNKNGSTSFSFAINNALQNRKLELMIKDRETRKIMVKLREDENGIYHIDHTFQTKGDYTVHILCDDQYVSTYQVRVK